MIRAALTSLGVAVFLAVTGAATAQDVTSTDTETAVREAVRRQAFTVELRQRLGEAGLAEQRKDVVAASKLFETAYDLSQKIGSGVDGETKAAIGGIVRTRVELASRDQSRGDFKDADTQLKSALRVDGKNQDLLNLKKANEGLLAAQAGRIPSPEVVDRIPTIVTNKIKNATLVQDGKLLYELGKWDDAEAKLKQVLTDEPDNRAAAYYMNLIQTARNNAAERNGDVLAQQRMVEIEDAKQPSLQREMLPVPNPYARTKLIHTDAGRQAIVSKLDRIVLNEVKYDGMDLGGVLEDLKNKSRDRDPDKQGINFIILADTGVAAAATPGAVDAAGNPVAATSESIDVSSVRINIKSTLSNMRLADMLDAIVKTAEKPIKYSIEDYAVIFSVKPSESPALYTRTFKVDPNTFLQGLESVGSISFGAQASSQGGGGGGNNGGGGNRGGGNNNGNQNSGGQVASVSVAGGGGGNRGGNAGGNAGGGGGGGLSFVTRPDATSALQTQVKAFFTAAGVDLTGPGKAVFFNDRKGILMVRATLQDLDIIEQAVQTLNVTPPQVMIRAKFTEVDQNDVRALGFNWFLGNTKLGGGSLGLQGGSAPSFNGSDPSGKSGPSTIFPGNYNAGTDILPSITDQVLTSGLRNQLNAPAIGTLTGILTDPQFRVVINALEQRDGTDTITAPQVTTVSGRQTHIEVTDLKSIVTGVDANQTGSGGGGVQNNGTSGNGAVGSTIQPSVDTEPFGPSLDVIPYVSADEYTIQMTIIPTVTEFVGYDTATAAMFAVQAQGSSGGTLTQQLPLPESRVRQLTTTCVVWDGQTVVLGGLISGSTLKTKDKVPMLGDLPLVGRLFRSESNSNTKKNLLIFVTPTIIDPAGNPLHSPEEMPFMQNNPTQRPGVAHQ